MTDRFLPNSLRRSLERDIKAARKVAEDGVSDAIRRLGVADAEAPGHLSDDDMAARRRLRAHARALGDTVTDGIHTVDHLVEAAAYAQWHRRLFARFLAERGLLRHPDHGVPVTLDEAEELAADEGYADGWSAAEAYAARMLPAVFQPNDPVLALPLAPEHAQALRKLVLGLDPETFQAEDALGWTYQFWRALEKDRVNKAGGKIGARELPAVTQLFTEPYMVKFLLHNTLGAWWAGKVLAADPTLMRTAKDEASLRTACALPGYYFDMLRFVREGEDGPWHPAAGTFPGWPKEPKSITLLDPCCGSGHFLTEALTVLAALRQSHEQLAPSEAVTAVLRDNLHGLEIDGRCVQIAAFAVALSAWRIGGWQTLPQPHIAWVGAPPPLPNEEFVALAEGDAELEYALNALHDLFANAPVLGSLIEVAGGNIFESEQMQKIGNLLDSLIRRYKTHTPEQIEGAISARGMMDATGILFRKFTIVSTNVPYLGIQKHDEAMLLYIDDHFPVAKHDLATAFLERIKRWLEPSGASATVSLGEWLYLGPYTEYRREFLQRHSPKLICRLGWNAFSYPIRANPALVVDSNLKSSDDSFSLIDCSDSKDFISNKLSVSEVPILATDSKIVLNNPDSRFVARQSDGEPLLEQVAESRSGLHAGDMLQFFAQFWEIGQLGQTWEPVQTAASSTTHFSGRDKIIKWEQESGSLFRLAESVKHLNHAAQNWRAGKPFWGKSGIIVGLMGSAACSIYTGEIFDSNSSAIVPKRKEDLPAIWAFCESGEFSRLVRQIDNSLKLAPRTLLKIPFDREYWESVASEKFSHGLPEPYSDDATQWTFHGHPRNCLKGMELHVALARLAGYRWPAEGDPDMRLSAEARDRIAMAATLPEADADGVLPILAVAGDRPLADRLRDYLNIAIPGWDEATLVREADEQIDKRVGKDLSLEAWLRDRAFRQHCALFQSRPFLWQVWDGQKDGFSAFLHYHRLDHAALQKLTYTLLGAWIARRKAENDERRVEAAMILQKKLEAILEGEAPYDIFVRWKSLAQQPIGWNPDLDDGVRLNIRPWVEAGVLKEANPKGIKWGVDRGKDVTSAPWFNLDKGERNNDRHITLADKHAAREAAAAKVGKA